MDDLKGAELTGVDFTENPSSTGNASPAAEPKSSVEADVTSATTKGPRTELPTEVINASNRDRLTSIVGIDEVTQHSLYKAGFLSFGDLAKASERELQLATSKLDQKFSSSDFSLWTAQAALFNEDDLETIKKQATQSAPLDKVVSSATPAISTTPADDLTKIRGIGPATAELLQAAGITSFAGLNQAGTPRLQEILDGGGAKFAVVDPSMWCRQAEFAMARTPTETIVLNAEPDAGSTAVSTPKFRTSPATIVLSTDTQDDLTKIAGIGPATQQALRENGIEQFEQVAGMTADQLKDLLSDAR